MAFKYHALRTLVASVGLVCASTVFGQAPSTASLVGIWDITLTSPQGTHPSTITLREDAGKVTGTVQGLPGATSVVVTSTDAGVTLAFSVNHQGQPLAVLMTGKVDGSTIKGTVDYANGQEVGDFMGTRKAATGTATDTTAAGATASTGSPTTGSSSTAAAGTVAGQWAITSDAGSVWSMALVQDGSAVTGTLTDGDNAATYQAKGTFTAGALSLVATGQPQGQPIELTVKGTLEGESLKGTYSVGDSNGTWTAMRKP